MVRAKHKELHCLFSNSGNGLLTSKFRWRSFRDGLLASLWTHLGALSETMAASEWKGSWRALSRVTARPWDSCSCVENVIKTRSWVAFATVCDLG